MCGRVEKMREWRVLFITKEGQSALSEGSHLQPDKHQATLPQNCSTRPSKHCPNPRKHCNDGDEAHP